MIRQNFYRSKVMEPQICDRKLRTSKPSFKDLQSCVRKPLFELKNVKQTPKRHSADSYQNSKPERSTFRNKKFNLLSSVRNTLLLSQNGSPLKFTHKTTFDPLKNYQFYYQIGFGGFGKVWKVISISTSKPYAMKQISKSRVIAKNNVESILNERRILSKLTHPFLVNMQKSFQNSRNLYLVMDYLRGGDLRYHLCYKSSFNEKEIRFIAACLILSLEYIHQNQIIHKDLKPQNIIFQENGYLRVTDFGIAKEYDSFHHKDTQSSGTPVYMAPQILFKQSFSFQSDYYALGVILYELMLERRPYEGKTREDIRNQMKSYQVQIREDNRFNPLLVDFVNALLKIDPSQRLGRNGIQQLKHHPYLQNVKWKKLLRKQIKPPFIPNVICQTKLYLDQIELFNKMHCQNQHQSRISTQINAKFADYDFDRTKKPLIKKNRRISQQILQYR